VCVNARDAISGVGRLTIGTLNTTIDEAACRNVPGSVAGDYVVLEVSDNGAGMSTDVLDRVFEPFFTTKELGRGTGLGLATVYGIVKQNDGLVTVDSKPGIGTTFRIQLPRDAGEIAETLLPGASDIPESCGESVLLVEDEPAILALGKTMLQRLGYEVLTASTPDEALRHAGAHPGRIDLLITDVVMPGMNGRDLAARVVAIRPEVKSLFMSGYTADVIATRGVLDDGVHFIQKPFSMRSLAMAVRQTLGGA
jgi:CheY-like chemotaxis protein